MFTNNKDSITITRQIKHKSIKMQTKNCKNQWYQSYARHDPQDTKFWPIVGQYYHILGQALTLLTGIPMIYH